MGVSVYVTVDVVRGIIIEFALFLGWTEIRVVVGEGGALLVWWGYSLKGKARCVCVNTRGTDVDESE